MPPNKNTAPESGAIADYIEQLSEEMAKMAADAGLDMLAYLLDMVRIEADMVRKSKSDDGKPS